ncbi:52 kDa repressor of the inhibitor of the protein kinase-like [Rhopalosiphum padi]|uniref:52 kDa repressor of the inhibitor of the protein kinase-like n=1 Tax=Rhopalosiphum padi TaxID=40932 RepID=UPI00298DFF60|nr:52 kDa repressor of the inhibitor of the protein kinase-like [Rhopalosiphum padi]XP_060847695.1 52 kDa repressor of the inhibitor of the protein kinase-like [Rhopalosiphum padi]
MANVISLNLSVKRITKRQTNRANPFTDSDNNKISDINVEHYYRTTIFIPYLDFFIAQLEERFTAHKTIFKGFETIFSKNQFLNASEIESFKNLAEFYSPHVNKDNSLAELKIWRTKILDNSEVIKTGLDALQLCSSSIYTNLNKLLKILCVLPVSTSTPERTFSTLKRVKTYTRNSMLEDRLNGLTLLAVHKDISITSDEVLDEMSMKPRKLELIL